IPKAAVRRRRLLSLRRPHGTLLSYSPLADQGIPGFSEKQIDEIFHAPRVRRCAPPWTLNTSRGYPPMPGRSHALFLTNGISNPVCPGQRTSRCSYFAQADTNDS
ncbi:unnamed protein product, partial [Ectocarpus sp. 8 AP-2014]